MESGSFNGGIWNTEEYGIIQGHPFVYDDEIKRDLIHGGLEHLKIETRLRGERFESVKGECVI
jgi:hypothetical protein